MIQKIDNSISSLIESNSFLKRQVASRVLAVAVNAFIQIEAAYKTLYAALTISVYVITEPFTFAAKIFKVIRDPQYTLKKHMEEENAAFGKVAETVFKAMAAVADIFISLLLGIFSPYTMIEWHVFRGYTTKPIVAKPNVFVISTPVKKNLDEKFICFHLNDDDKKRLKEYGLIRPHSIVLHGPSKSAQKQAAEYIAAKLNKNLKELKSLDVSNLNLLNDIIFLNIPDKPDQKILDLISILDEKKIMYILGSKLPLTKGSYTSKVHVEIPLPDEAIRREVLQRDLKLIPIEENFDFSKVVAATEGCKTEKIEKITQSLKLKALQEKSKITTNQFLEVVTLIKNKSKVELPPVNDFVGMEDLLKKFDLYLQVFKNPKEAKEYGVKLPAGILLYGLPGCGKSYTAKHLCNYAKSQGVQLNFHQVLGSDIATKWKGEGVKNIRRVFEEAKNNAPALLFIDECEGLFPSRDKLKDTLSEERTQELDELLQMIEQAKEHNVIVVGATNQISTIDSAILRTGRFDYTFEIKPPNSATRLKMFEAKLKLKKCDPHLDLKQIVDDSEGFTPSDIETIINDAGIVSWTKKVPISIEILKESFKTVKLKKSGIDQEVKKGLAQAPIMQDLKKGLDAFKQLINNVEGVNPQVAVANNMI